MRITIHFTDPDCAIATIHVAPSLLERILLGTAEIDDVVIRLGDGLWIRDSTGRRVRSRKIVDALEHRRWVELRAEAVMA